MSEQTDLIMLPCPHCNGVAQLECRIDYGGTGEYARRGADYLYVHCTECGAKSGEFHRKYFCDMTEYRVDDFRRNPALRARVEEEYDAYCEEIKKEPVNAWNKRVSKNDTCSK